MSKNQTLAQRVALMEGAQDELRTEMRAGFAKFDGQMSVMQDTTARILAAIEGRTDSAEQDSQAQDTKPAARQRKPRKAAAKPVTATAQEEDTVAKTTTENDKPKATEAEVAQRKAYGAERRIRKELNSPLSKWLIANKLPAGGAIWVAVKDGELDLAKLHKLNGTTVPEATKALSEYLGEEHIAYLRSGNAGKPAREVAAAKVAQAPTTKAAPKAEPVKAEVVAEAPAKAKKAKKDKGAKGTKSKEQVVEFLVAKGWDRATAIELASN